MDQVGHQPFSHAGFPEDEYGGVHPADLQRLAKDLEHCRAFRDHPAGFQFLLLQLEQLVAELVRDRLLFLEFPVEGVDLREVALVHHDADQVSRIVEDGVAGEHKYPAFPRLEQVRRCVGPQDLESRGFIEDPFPDEVRHVSSDHLVGLDVVQSLGRGIDPEDVGLSVADP